MGGRAEKWGGMGGRGGVGWCGVVRCGVVRCSAVWCGVVRSSSLLFFFLFSHRTTLFSSHHPLLYTCRSMTGGIHDRPQKQPLHGLLLRSREDLRGKFTHLPRQKSCGTSSMCFAPQTRCCSAKMGCVASRVTTRSLACRPSGLDSKT